MKIDAKKYIMGEGGASRYIHYCNQHTPMPVSKTALKAMGLRPKQNEQPARRGPAYCGWANYWRPSQCEIACSSRKLKRLVAAMEQQEKHEDDRRLLSRLENAASAEWARFAANQTTHTLADRYAQHRAAMAAQGCNPLPPQEFWRTRMPKHWFVRWLARKNPTR
jgi:hypothetical protein